MPRQSAGCSTALSEHIITVSSSCSIHMYLHSNALAPAERRPHNADQSTSSRLQALPSKRLDSQSQSGGGGGVLGRKRRRKRRIQMAASLFAVIGSNYHPAFHASKTSPHTPHTSQFQMLASTTSSSASSIPPPRAVHSTSLK